MADERERRSGVGGLLGGLSTLVESLGELVSRFPAEGKEFRQEGEIPQADRESGLKAVYGFTVRFVPTASGDSPGYVARFHRAFARHACTPAHLELFRRKVSDLRALLLAQDLIYVGGGNTANMLAVWRLHGVDRSLREAWERGVVLCGVSAGANCWFESSVTDSFGQALQPLPDGLALLPGSFCPHYDGEAARRSAYRKSVGGETLSGGHAADDSVAVLFEGAQLADVVGSRPGLHGYRVELVEGAARETALPARLLPGGPQALLGKK